MISIKFALIFGAGLAIVDHIVDHIIEQKKRKLLEMRLLSEAKQIQLADTVEPRIKPLLTDLKR